jgi:hypothetical protein
MIICSSNSLIPNQNHTQPTILIQNPTQITHTTLMKTLTIFNNIQTPIYNMKTHIINPLRTHIIYQFNYRCFHNQPKYQIVGQWPLVNPMGLHFSLYRLHEGHQY